MVSASAVWSAAQTDARALAASLEPRRLLGGVLAGADAGVIAAASAAAYIARLGVTAAPLDIVSSTGLAVVLTLNAIYLSGGYTANVMHGFAAQAARVSQAWTGVFALLLVLGYLTKTSETYSRIWAVGWYGLALVGLMTLRVGVALHVRRWRSRGRLSETVAIVDLDGQADELARRLRVDHPLDVRLVGVFRPTRGPDGQDGIADLLALARLFRIDEVLVLAAPHTMADVTGTLRRLGTLPTNVRLCPVLPKLGTVPIRQARFLFEMPTLIIHRRPFAGWSGIIKRGEDIVIGAVLALLALPLMLAIAAAIKAETAGPIFFRQARQGFNNNVFTVLKFRSMYHRAEPAGSVQQATRKDGRVTRVGSFIRRTSLDELPQLFNVLRGEMSLVGPRPHAVVHNSYYAPLIDDYIGRHRVRPGLTGWAQVNGLRGETDTVDKMQRRVEFDLAYIDYWSVFFDIKIIVLTALVAFFDRHAY